MSAGATPEADPLVACLPFFFFVYTGFFRGGGISEGGVTVCD